MHVFTQKSIIDVQFVVFSHKTQIGESFPSVTTDLFDFHTNNSEQYL